MSNAGSTTGQTVVCFSWAELASGRDALAAPVQIAGERFVIGRAPDCHLQLNMKMLSARHCYIHRDKEGKAWLYDTSTNGTFINKSTKVPNGQKHELKSGDQIYLICRKKQPQLDVYYTFRTLKDKEDSPLDGTLEYSLEDTESTETQDNSPATKIPKVGSEQDVAGLPANDDAPVASDEKTAEAPPPDADAKPETPKTVPARKSDSMADYLQCSLCLEILYDPICLQPCLHCYCAGCYSGWMDISQECPQCRRKVKCMSRNHLINNLLEVYLTQHPEVKRSETDTALLDSKNKITEEMLKAGTNARKRPHPGAGHYYFDSDGSDAYDNGSTTEDSYDSDSLGAYLGGDVFPRAYAAFQCRQCPNSPHRRHLNGKTRPVSQKLAAVGSGLATAVQAGAAAVPPPAAQDQTHTDGAAVTGDQTPSDSPSTSVLQGDRHLSVACPPSRVHQNCHCCNELMPVRLAEIATDPSIPPQKCAVCSNLFCHLYWGCRLPGCNGCLGKFADLDFGDDCIRTLVNENIAESQILSDYLTSLGQSWRDLLRECLARLDSGRYQLVPAMTSATVLCRQCGLRYFRELAYSYRRDIPDRHLPAPVTNRPDCYWGRNCRTQKHNPTHAWNYNHICNQTRFR